MPGGVAGAQPVMAAPYADSVSAFYSVFYKMKPLWNQEYEGFTKWRTISQARFQSGVS